MWPHALVGLVTFSTMFGVLTELPGALSHAPYSLSAGLMGVSGCLSALHIDSRLAQMSAVASHEHSAHMKASLS